MMTIPLEFTSPDLVDESSLRLERYKERKRLRKLSHIRRKGLPRVPLHPEVLGEEAFNNDLLSPTPPYRKKMEGEEEELEIDGEEEKLSVSSEKTRFSSFSSSSTCNTSIRTPHTTAFSRLSSSTSTSSYASASLSPPIEEASSLKLPKCESSYRHKIINNNNKSPIDDSSNAKYSSLRPKGGQEEQEVVVEGDAEPNQRLVEEIVQLLKVATGGPSCIHHQRMPSPRSQSSAVSRGIFSSSRQQQIKAPDNIHSDSSGRQQYDETLIRQVDFKKEFDVLQKIGEGWFSRVYLSEYIPTGEELVIKMINSQKVKCEDFLQEVRYSILLSSHKNILRIYDGLVFQARGHFVFAAEYAPLGDLTSNVLSERGIGETATKSITKQIGSALEWVHSKNLCHLDVKLDNILVFKSDFSKVKLCDFGSVRPQGDIVIKKNELLPYCPPELFARHANEYYQVDKMQDVFQFGVVIFFCLFGILPWQKADTKTDPHFGEFFSWRSKKGSGKIPKNFKPLTNKGQKFFKKILDPDPFKRLPIVEVPKFTEDKWIRNKKSHSLTGSLIPPNLIHDLTNGNFPSSNKSGSKDRLQRQISRSIHSDPLKNNHPFLSDGFSQITMGSFRSVHSNVEEKNRSLYPLLQAGVETTVDRTQKHSRILKWIQSSNKKPTHESSEHAENNASTTAATVTTPFRQ